MDLSFRPIIPASANNNNGTTPVTIGQPTFPPPNGKIVSAEMIRYFQDIIVYEFPTINKSYLKDCAVVAAFLQSTRVFDFLFFGTGDKLLYDGYFDTLIECLEKGLPVKNIMSRTFCCLMSKYGFNPNFHTITFTGDALGSFAEVLKSKFIFKDMVGKQHGQYTHTLQWFGVCLLSDEPGLIEGNYKFTNCIADLYAYMISPVSTSKFPGEATLDKTTNQVLEKTPYIRPSGTSASTASAISTTVRILKSTFTRAPIEAPPTWLRPWKVRVRSAIPKWPTSWPGGLRNTLKSSRSLKARMTSRRWPRHCKPERNDFTTTLAPAGSQIRNRVRPCLSGRNQMIKNCSNCSKRRSMATRSSGATSGLPFGRIYPPSSAVVRLSFFAYSYTSAITLAILRSWPSGVR